MLPVLCVAIGGEGTEELEGIASAGLVASFAAV